jgi:invasion protein IalB
MKPRREGSQVSKPEAAGTGGSRRALALAAAFALAFMAAVQAQAQETKRLGIYGPWTAYAVNGASEPICYMAAKPIKSRGKYKKRGKMWVLVSHLRGRDNPDEVQIVAGYRFKKGSVVELVIDRKNTFTLFTDKGDAWAYNGEDQNLVKAMKRGLRMVVKGTSDRNTETTDSYSLNGFTRAHDEIAAACGLR